MPVANGGYNLFRYLEQRLPGVLRPRYREMMHEAGRTIPTEPDLAPGAYEVVKQVYNHYGEATVLAPGAFDIPIVDISGDEDRYRILMIAAGVTTSFDEQRKSEYGRRNGYQQIDPYQERLQVASLAIQEKRNRIAAYGVPALGITGLLNNASVSADNSSFDPYASTTTASDLADFFMEEVFQQYEGSNWTYYANTVLISPHLDERMTKLTMPDSGITVKRHVLDALKEEDYNVSIIRCPECLASKLEANGVENVGTNKDRIVIYPREPEAVERHVEMIQMMPEEFSEVKDGKRVYPMFGCTTPTMVNQIPAFSYIRIAKKP